MQSNRIEKIGLYIAALSGLFMFWQSWRDLHNDNSDLKERQARIEERYEILHERISELTDRMTNRWTDR